jgi:hypothetical protein
MANPTIALVAWLRTMGLNAHLTPPGTGTRYATVTPVGGPVADMLAHPSYDVRFYAQSASDAQADAWDALRAFRLTQPPAGIVSAQADAVPYGLGDPDRPALSCQHLTVDLTCQI